MSDLTEQYATDENLRIRIETHRLYTIGPPLEPAVDAALALTGTESLLDIGTGPGDFPIRLRNAGHRGPLVGIDSSPGMAAKARSSAADIEFLQADAQHLPFRDESFDVVTARHMLYHVPDIPLALQEAHRVLKPGGKFLAITNIHDNFAEYRHALREAADALAGTISDALRIVVSTTEGFNDKNGPAFIHRAFGNVSTSFVEAALRFETAEPALRYFDSCRTLRGLTVEDWRLARQQFAKVIARRLENGPWLISKTIVLLTATK
jgi:SAM-dependent methyltransferase